MMGQLRDAGSFDQICESGEASPDDGCSWRRVGGTVKITTEPRDCLEVEI